MRFGHASYNNNSNNKGHLEVENLKKSFKKSTFFFVYTCCTICCRLQFHSLNSYKARIHIIISSSNALIALIKTTYT